MTERGIPHPAGLGNDLTVEAGPSAVVPEFTSRRAMREAETRGRRRSGTGRERRRVARPSRIPLRKQLARAGVMTVVGGLFASLTIPAYANQDAVLQEKAGPLAAQTQIGRAHV